MARDKRGHSPEPDVDEVLDELAQEEGGSDADFLAGPTSRNEAGDVKRAAAKATGIMGSSKKIDPDLAVDPDGNRPKSGSKSGLHTFQEVPPEKGVTEHRVTRGNAEIADEANTAARLSPAGRAARTEAAPTNVTGGRGSALERRRVPAPGNVVDVPKGTLVRGHPTASQSGGRSQSSTGDEKPPKRSARAGTGQTERPLSKGGTEERD
ncbi:MAG TPA: hypothetical protein VIL09_08225 [Microvirga sp.]|jgi:hypothetical protein